MLVAVETRSGRRMWKGKKTVEAKEEEERMPSGGGKSWRAAIGESRELSQVTRLTPNPTPPDSVGNLKKR